MNVQLIIYLPQIHSARMYLPRRSFPYVSLPMPCSELPFRQPPSVWRSSTSCSYSSYSCNLSRAGRWLSGLSRMRCSPTSSQRPLFQICVQRAKGTSHSESRQHRTLCGWASFVCRYRHQRVHHSCRQYGSHHQWL